LYFGFVSHVTFGYFKGKDLNNQGLNPSQFFPAGRRDSSATPREKGKKRKRGGRKKGTPPRSELSF